MLALSALNQKNGGEDKKKRSHQSKVMSEDGKKKREERRDPGITRKLAGNGEGRGRGTLSPRFLLSVGRELDTMSRGQKNQ